MTVLRDWVQEGPSKVSAYPATNSTFFNILVGYILYPALLNLHSLVCSESLVMFCLLDWFALPSPSDSYASFKPSSPETTTPHTLVFRVGPENTGITHTRRAAKQAPLLSILCQSFDQFKTRINRLKFLLLLHWLSLSSVFNQPQHKSFQLEIHEQMCKQQDGQQIITCFYTLSWSFIGPFFSVTMRSTPSQQQNKKHIIINIAWNSFFPFFLLGLVIEKSFDLSLNFVFIFVASVMNVVQ